MKELLKDTTKHNRLANNINTTPCYWVSIQSRYDLGQCHPQHLDDIQAIA